jgi:hypothetical protein
METRWLTLQNTIRRRRRFGAKRGVSEIVGAVFLILIIFVAFAVFSVMFNSFVLYTQQEQQAESQQVQNQETSLSSAMEFGSPVVPSGTSNPPTFNVNSIGTATVQSHYTFESKMVYAQSLWWAFYSSGTAIVYETSSDGITWSNTATLTALAGSTVSYGFSDTLLGSTLYFVLATYHTGTNSFTLGDVPLNAGGTIGTVTTAAIALNTGYDAGAYDSIAVDTSASTYIWVALNVYRTTTTDTFVEVERCTTALACTSMDGTAAPSITSGTTTNDQIPMINDLSGGSISVVYANAGGEGPAFALEPFNFRTCTGGTATTAYCQGGTAANPPTWTGPAAATTSTFYPEHTSSIAMGTTTYFAGTNGSGVGTWSFGLGSTTDPKTYQITTAVTGAAAPADIAEYGTGNTLGTNNKLQVFFGSGTTLYNASSTSDTAWPAPNTISTSETGLLGLNALDNSTLSGVFWTSGAASPYTIRFAEANTKSYNPTMISPSSAYTTTTTETATSSTSENKLIYDQGLWWDFFSTGAGIDYVTSADGLTWSAATSVSTAAGDTLGSDFSLALSGNTVYWVLATSDTAASFTYNTATLSSAGTIAAGTAYTATTAYTSTGPISIGIDVSGNVWVALTTLQTGPTYHIEVYEHASGSANNAGWSGNLAPSSLPTLTASAVAEIDGLQTGAGAALIVQTSGSTAGTTGTVSIYSTTVTSGWTTGTWTTAVSSTDFYSMTSSSEVVVGGTLAFAGLSSSSASSTTGTLNFWTFVIGVTATFPTETIIESATANWQAALGVYGNTLSLFDASPSVSTINYYDSANLGQTWSTKAVATTYEPSVTGLTAAAGGTMGVTWTNGNPANAGAATLDFNVRFASLSSLTITNNSGFAIQLISFFVTNPNTNTLLLDYINSPSQFDYWVNGGGTVSVAFSFTWATVTTYQITIGTSSGVVYATDFTSPS